MKMRNLSIVLLFLVSACMSDAPPRQAPSKQESCQEDPTASIPAHCKRIGKHSVGAM